MCSPVSVFGSLPGSKLPSDFETGIQAATQTPSSTSELTRPATRSTRRRSTVPALNFSRLNLVCPIDADGIRNRWLNLYLPVPGQTIKTLPTNVTAFTLGILKSYAAIAVRGHDLPRFLHPTQMLHTSISPPLATCLSLLRICDKPLPGSEGVAAEVLQREMHKLHAQHGTYDEDDDMTPLADFQAYLLYTLALYFRLGREADPFFRQAMMNLQEIACSCAARGLVCTAEQRGARPVWEAWIVAEAKRRTLLTMYLLDNVLSVRDGLPTFLGTELRGLPAPAGKALWQAGTRDDWEKAYNFHLTEWTDPEGGLCIDELWPFPADLDDAGIAKRRSRVDRWLEGVDEFGTAIYAVTTCTHGG